MPGGRKTKYNPDMVEQAYKLSLLGAIDTELAGFFNVDVATIQRWKKRHPEFCDAIKEGKDVADANVAQRLYTRAMGYSHPDTIYASKDGMITDMREITKHYPPDTVAAIFWLKNRQPRLWRDKVDHAVEVSEIRQLTDEQLQLEVERLARVVLRNGDGAEETE